MKMTKLIVLCFLVSVNSFGQGESKTSPFERNTIYAEVFGQGLFGSVNYDRLFHTDRRIMNSVTFGFVAATKSLGFGDGAYLGMPISYNWLFGQKSHHLELGVGFTFLATKDFGSNSFANYYTYLTPKIGYRFQRPKGGLFFRATIAPLVSLMNVRVNSFGDDNLKTVSFFKNAGGLGYSVFPWPGLSIGYSF